MSETPERSFPSRTIHDGDIARYGPSKPSGGSIDPSTVWSAPDLDTMNALFEGEVDGYYYASRRTPNADELASLVASLEGAEAGVATASGMSAFLALFAATLEAGDRVILPDDVYGGTRALFVETLARFGVTADNVDIRDLDAVRAATTDRTRWIVAESLSNPTTRLADLGALRVVADETGCRLLCDNTFATPFLFRPLEHGAHAVLHSVSKFLSGHHDVMAGALVADRELIDAVSWQVTRCGVLASAHVAWLAVRGIRTLVPRMERISMTALAIASALDDHPALERVWYPLLPDHPEHDLAQSLLPRGAGGMMSFTLHGEREAADRFVRALKLIELAPSLGGVESTISHPVIASHRAIPDEVRRRHGITPGMIRLSVGLEEPRDLIEDIDAALDAAAG